ncbi:MAG: ceramidase domain-containing protein [Thiohalomonadales bacterium]
MGNYLDHYCERVAAGLWDEPFNVLSNLGFFIVAYLCWRNYQKHKVEVSALKPDIVVLIILMFFIGVGSSLWHIYATQFTLWADRIPILLFINIYLLSCLFRGLHCRVPCGIGVFALYHIVGITVLISLPLDTLNGSLFYLPTWLSLGLLCIVVWRQNIDPKRYYLMTFALFGIAILFRSIDLRLCETLSIGTHFIWHLLVSATLYPAMLALVHTTSMQNIRATKILGK